jgi:1,4-dihydroxy-2-naphthoate octaprenyltransferase
LITYLKALRAFSLPISVLPVFLAVAVALPADDWDLPLLLASALGAGLLHLAGNLLNDYFDYRKGVDRLEEDPDRPGRQLVHRQLTAGQVLGEAGLCLLLASIPVAYVLHQSGWGILWYAVAALAGAYAYTGPPFQLKYHAMGEVLVFLTFGPLLMLGAAQVQTGRLEWQVLLISIPVGMVTCAVLAGNNYRDRSEDAQAGIRTLAHVLGPRGIRWMYAGLTCSALAMLAILALAGVAPWPLALSPALLILLARPLRAMAAGRRLSDIDVRTARFETVLLGFLCLLFVWDRLG